MSQEPGSSQPRPHHIQVLLSPLQTFQSLDGLPALFRTLGAPCAEVLKEELMAAAGQDSHKLSTVQGQRPSRPDALLPHTPVLQLQLPLRELQQDSPYALALST